MEDSHKGLHPSELELNGSNAKETFSFIPNLERIFAEAPALLKGSMILWDLFETTSFTKIEQQVIYLKCQKKTPTKNEGDIS
ncbi:MAG: hypothetical protein QNJ53_23375 [Pleurocapsa sp. MO_192.B19]|nr:hypothetical protein [Pleurocapsa sp. MO_192.B19]